MGINRSNSCSQYYLSPRKLNIHAFIHAAVFATFHGDAESRFRIRIASMTIYVLKQMDLHHGLHNHAPTMPKTRIHRLNQVPVSLMRGYLSDLPGSLGSALLDTSRRNSCSNGPFGTIVLLPGIPPDSEVPQSWVQLTIVC